MAAELLPPDWVKVAVAVKRTESEAVVARVAAVRGEEPAEGGREPRGRREGVGVGAREGVAAAVAVPVARGRLPLETETAPPVWVSVVGEAGRVPTLSPVMKAVELVPVAPPVRVREPPVKWKREGVEEKSREAAEREPEERL